MLAAQIEKSQVRLAFCLLVLVAAVFFPSFGTWDILTWLHWGDNVEREGLVAGYVANHHEHPPLMSVIFWLSYRLADLLGVNHFYGIKSGFAVFLAGTLGILYRLFRHAPATIVFAGMVLIHSCLALSYLDIYIAPFVLLAFIYLQEKRLQTGLLMFSIAVLIKYPPLILAPFIMLYVLHQVQGSVAQNGCGYSRTLLQILWPSLLLVGFVLGVFGQEPVHALVRAFQHSDLSANALNFNWVQTRIIQLFFSGKDLLAAYNDDAQLIRNPPVFALTLARVLFYSSYLAAFLLFWRQKKTMENLLLYCLLGHMAYFMFAIGAHENHFFLSMLIVLMLCSINQSFNMLAINIGLINALNLFAFHGYNGQLPDLWRGAPVSGLQGDMAWMNGGPPLDFRLLLAVFNVVFFVILWFAVLRQGLFLHEDSTGPDQPGCR